MGSGISSLGYTYQDQRNNLRKELINTFLSSVENADIITKLKILRDLVTIYPEICLTAAAEIDKPFDFSLTNVESAYIELDRLYAIYETSTILK